MAEAMAASGNAEIQWMAKTGGQKIQEILKMSESSNENWRWMSVAEEQQTDDLSKNDTTKRNYSLSKNLLWVRTVTFGQLWSEQQSHTAQSTTALGKFWTGNQHNF